MRVMQALAAGTMVLVCLGQATEAGQPAGGQALGGIVKERRAVMKELGEHMRTVMEYIRGAGVSEGEVQGRVSKIKAIADRMPDFFPEGSGMDDGIAVETGAKAAIWTDWQGFEGKADFFSSASGKLLDASAEGDRSAMMQQFMLVGKEACSGCHETFRHKLEGTD